MRNPNEYSTYNELTDLLLTQGLLLDEAEIKYPLTTHFMLMPTASIISMPVLKEMQRIKYDYGFIPSFHMLFDIPDRVNLDTPMGQAFAFTIHKGTPAEVFTLACQVTDKEDMLTAVATHILCQ